MIFTVTINTNEISGSPLKPSDMATTIAEHLKAIAEELEEFGLGMLCVRMRSGVEIEVECEH